MVGFSNFLRLALLLVVMGVVVAPAAAAPSKPPTDLKARIVRQYARTARSMYEESERRALSMRERIAAFLAAPSPETLAAAREAWLHARLVYGQSEVLRFYGGPIDDADGGDIRSAAGAESRRVAIVDGITRGTAPPLRCR